MLLLRRVALALGLAYALLCGAVHQRYREMLYPAPAEDGGMLPPSVREITLTAADGAPVHVLETRPRRFRWMVVYFHGNGEVIGSHVDLAGDLAQRGLATTLVEYRGYGRSAASGHPTEEGLYADATAALDHLLKEGIGPDRIALWGFSLGTGVAAEMAARGRGARLLLEAPYTSIPDVARHLHPWIPAGWAIDDRFDTLRKAKSIQVPTFILHGDRDGVIPASMPERLRGVLAESRLVEIQGGDHADLLAREGEWLWNAVTDFFTHGISPIIRQWSPTGRVR